MNLSLKPCFLQPGKPLNSHKNFRSPNSTSFKRFRSESQKEIQFLFRKQKLRRSSPLSNEDKLWFKNLCQKHNISTLQKNDEKVLLAYAYLEIFGETDENNEAHEDKFGLGKLVSFVLE